MLPINQSQEGLHPQGYPVRPVWYVWYLFVLGKCKKRCCICYRNRKHFITQLRYYVYLSESEMMRHVYIPRKIYRELQKDSAKLEHSTNEGIGVSLIPVQE